MNLINKINDYRKSHIGKCLDSIKICLIDGKNTI